MAALTITSAVKLASGHRMPVLGLGVYQNYDCEAACLAALKHGYRHIDTAQVYRNEEQVGSAMQKSGVPRDTIFITSKVIEGGAKTKASVEQSIKKLNLDYIDLYIIHSAHGGKQHRLETWKTLIDFKAQGKLRDIGVSNYSVVHLEEIREAGLELPAVNQVELHPFCQQKPIVEYCDKHNILIQAYCPLVRGKFDDPVLQEVCKTYKKEPAQVLVRWSLQRGFTPLPKSEQPERIKSNADVYDFEISKDNMAKLDALDKGSKGAISWNPINVE